MGIRLPCAVAIVALISGAADAIAAADGVNDSIDRFDSGKLLATAGVNELEGAGGGGLVPWALITGYGTSQAIGADAHFTHVALPDYTIDSEGAAVGMFDRAELSYARLALDTGSTGGRLGLGNGFTFDEHVFGAKLRLFGDAIYDQDRMLPQVAVGVFYKTNDQRAVLRAIGARDADGVDFYVTATKLLLAQSLLVTGALRETRANQFGILGFGGDQDNGYATEFEGSAAVLLTRAVAVGAEFRTKPNNLRFAGEDDVGDLFAAYFVNKHLSATLAFVALGDIATQKNQNGVYLSLQSGF
jgi:hypothetical protein